MEHVKLLMIKFIATFVLSYLVLGIGYGLSFGQILLISLPSIAIYFIGDLLILERTNNFIATLSDFAVNFTIVFLLLNLIGFNGDQIMAGFMTSIVLSIYEMFFHVYVSEQLNFIQERIPVHRYDYMTEFTEEFDPFLDEDDEEDDYY